MNNTYNSFFTYKLIELVTDRFPTIFHINFMKPNKLF